MENKKIEIKNKHLFKNKWQMVIYLVLFGVLIYLFIYLGTLDYGDELPDNERFASEFSMVSEDNVFTYVNATAVRAIAGGDDGIVLFGTSNNEWVNYYAYIVNKVAMEVGIEEIYYYDFVSNRTDNNGTYEDILIKLSNYCLYDDTGNADIYAPTLLIVSDGEVLLFDTDTNFVSGSITPSTYYNSYTVGLKEAQLKAAFLEYLGEEDE